MKGKKYKSKRRQVIRGNRGHEKRRGGDYKSHKPLLVNNNREEGRRHYGRVEGMMCLKKWRSLSLELKKTLDGFVADKKNGLSWMSC